MESNNLTREEILKTAEAWYKDRQYDAVRTNRMVERFMWAIDRQEHIRELATTPMLLNILIRANNFQELPDKKLGLYKLCVRFMLEDWDIDRLLEGTPDNNKHFDSEDKVNILRTVAAKMQPRTDDFGFTQNAIVETELQAIIEDYLKLKAFKAPAKTAKMLIENLFYLRDYLLRYNGDAFYVSVHQRFFEYFRANYFVDLFEHKRKISFADLKTEVFGKHWQDHAWHGTLVLIAAGTYEEFALEIVDYLMSQSMASTDSLNILLAGECFVQISSHHAQQSTAVATRLCAKLKSLTPKSSPDAVWRQASMLLYRLKW